MKRFLFNPFSNASAPHDPISHMVREEVETMLMARRFDCLAARQRKRGSSPGT